VACRSGGVVRPVRWPTHRLGLLPFSPPSHGHTHTQLSFISTLVSLSNCVEEERKKKKSNKKQRRKWKEEGEEEEKRKEKKEIKTWGYRVWYTHGKKRNKKKIAKEMNK